MAIEIYTDDDINRLKQAIALGALQVEYADKKVIYRSLSDMMRTLRFMQDEIANASGECPDDGKRYFQFDKGL